VCPLRALLNNLEPRIQRYAGMVGRRAVLWHGDVGDSRRRQILREPPDILLTTPESLEAILISNRVEHRSLFAALQTVIVDELHAFAGDDRGWHLLALMERLERLCGRPVQRIGLSATVGNPKIMMEWLARGRPGRVVGVLPHKFEGDVHIDYVGSLENAATVLTRLYRGQRRLVFCDSRARVETLATRLRDAAIRTFVSHSSLSADERRRAEAAFTAEPDCVIVATSTLELGLDVGDLDRVVQIDSPATVSSFLQRMGRTGRRPGSRPNCLMLTTSTDALTVGLAIGQLWREGFIEQVQPPASPFHIFAQQVMALALQEGGIARGDWTWWIGDLLTGANAQIVDSIISHMLANEILVEDAGVVSLGVGGESRFGRRHFGELVAAFTTPLLLTVQYSGNELGTVGPSSLTPQQTSGAVILLGGRSWRVVEVDWPRRTVRVEPTKEAGRSRWLGSSRALHSVVAREVEKVLVTGEVGIKLSTRASAALDEIRSELPYIDGEMLPVVCDTDDLRLWTFAGGRANAMLARALRSAGALPRIVDNFGLSFHAADQPRVAAALECITEEDCEAPVDPRMLSELKFGSCLPGTIAEGVLIARLSDFDALRTCLRRPRRWIRV
jgi:ATP-dependent helicase Lhr and Lhr-like helicase